MARLSTATYHLAPNSGACSPSSTGLCRTFPPQPAASLVVAICRRCYMTARADGKGPTSILPTTIPRAHYYSAAVASCLFRASDSLHHGMRPPGLGMTRT